MDLKERTDAARQGEKGKKTNVVLNALEQSPGLVQATQEEQAVLWPCTSSGTVSHLKERIGLGEPKHAAA